MLNEIQKRILQEVADMANIPSGAVNIRSDGQKLYRHNTENIEIATVLARRTKLMIFDEPEAGIDLWSFARLTDTFREIHDSKQATIIIISHQERIIRLADEILLIAGGRLQDRGSVDEIYPKIMTQTLTGCNLLEVD